MAVNIKHLNGDASFLLEFDIPTSSYNLPLSPTKPSSKYTIVLDPWLAGDSTIVHKKFSWSVHNTPSCIASLMDLPETPDVVIISQDTSDHCHKETLTKLPVDGKTLILAEPASAKTIRKWKHFAPDKVITIPKFDKKGSAYTIPIHSDNSNSTPGEITIAYIAQDNDIAAIHKAIGITYQPPILLSPDYSTFPMTPPLTPQSTSFSRNRPLSILHAPHGIKPSALRAYIKYQLRPISAIPLTVLLHPFNEVHNPWYLGGTIGAGFPGGLELVQQLTPLAWISSHDEEKDVRGLATRKVKIQRHEREQVEEIVSPLSATFPDETFCHVIALESGEERCFTSAMHASSRREEEDYLQFVKAAQMNDLPEILVKDPGPKKGRRGFTTRLTKSCQNLRKVASGRTRRPSIPHADT